MKKNIIAIILIIILIFISLLIIKNYGKNKGIEDSEITIESKKDIVIKEYVEELVDETLNNNSEELKKSKKIHGLEISNIKITGKDNEAKIMINIKNTSKKVKEERDITLVMLDKDKNEIGKIGANLSSELKLNETMTIEIKTEINFINTYDFVIVDKSIFDMAEN